MKRFLIAAALLCLALAFGRSAPARAEGAGYTVEFGYGDSEYVLPGDTSVPLTEILDALGLTGAVSAVAVSDETLFSASDESGAWVVTAHRAFDTEEWMDVTIGNVTYRVTVTDAQTVIYIDEKGKEHAITNYKLLEYRGTDTGMDNGVYVTTDTDGYNYVKGKIDIVGDVTLIIRNNFYCEGLWLLPNSSLTIYCAKGCEDKEFRILDYGGKRRGICGYGRLTLCSGFVSTVTDVKDHPGFGAANGTYIKGGRLVAYGHNDTAAVGYGKSSYGDGEVVISGGAVEATGSFNNAAGIGCGSWNEAHVTISGGNVKATSGPNSAGIGGGYKSSGFVTITGGTVEARGTDGAGIGNGAGAAGGSVSIRGGNVKATGRNGIGGGADANCGPVTITGGTVNATGVNHGIGVSARYSVNGDIKITGGNVTAKSEDSYSGIGTSFYNNGRLILGWTKLSDRISGNFVSGDYRASSVSLQNCFWLGDNSTAALNTNLDGRTLIPSQTANVYRVRFYAEGSAAPWREQTLLPGSALSDPGDPYAGSAGVHCPGWRQGGYDGSAYTFGQAVTGDLNLYAPKQYTVTIKPNNGQADYEVYVKPGEALTRPDNPAQNYATFLGWRRAGDTTDYNFSSPVNAPFALEARWEFSGSIPYAGGVSGSYTAMTALQGDTLTTGDYVATASQTIQNMLYVSGTVNLILMDGVELTASKGIVVNEGNTLNIFGQSGGTGRLVSTGDAANAGIGSESFRNSGTINIYGGVVEASGKSTGAGIGGGAGGRGIVNIYGGSVTAWPDSRYAAAIGGGGGCGADVTIYGGTVNAYAGTFSAAIGGGREGHNASVTIHGGTVKAYASTFGAGIGSGYYGHYFNVIIYGGDISVTQNNNGAGIGAGYGSVYGTVTFRHGGTPITLNTTSMTNPILEGSFMERDTGALVTVDTMNGKTIVPCYGVFFDANGGAGEMVSVAVAIGRTYTLPACDFTAPEGKDFVCWVDADGAEYLPGQTVTPTGDLHLSALWLTPQTLSFADEAVSAHFGDAPFTNALSGAQSAVTWYSSDSTVATVNAATGEVTVVDIGETTIHASAARTETCAAATAAYTLTVEAKTLTPTIAVTGSYTYTGAAITPEITLKDGDATIDAAEYTFVASNNVKAGTATVTVTDAAGGRYDFEPVSASFTIVPKLVTVSGIVAKNKHYDGNTDAALDCTGAVIDGLVEGDALGVTAVGAFASADYGRSVAVNITGLALTGRDSGNYALADSGQQTATTADIYAPHTVRFVDYDGSAMTAFASQTVLNGQTATAPDTTDNTPARDDYRFMGVWNVWNSGDTGEAFDFSKTLEFDNTTTVTLTPKYSKLYGVFCDTSRITGNGSGQYTWKSLDDPDALAGDSMIYAVAGERIAVYAAPSDGSVHTGFDFLVRTEADNGDYHTQSMDSYAAKEDGHAEFIMPSGDVIIGGKFALAGDPLVQLRDENNTNLYHINSVDDLVLLQNWKSDDADKDMAGWTLKLEKDLDMTGTDFIGFKGVFKGIFDGNGYTISNVSIHIENGTDNPGFIWNLGGTIQDLTITGSVSGPRYVSTGGLVGRVGTDDEDFTVTLTNCTAIMDAGDALVGLVYGDSVVYFTNCFGGLGPCDFGGTQLYTVKLPEDDYNGVVASDLSGSNPHVIDGKMWFEAGDSVTMNLTANARERNTLVGFQYEYYDEADYVTENLTRNQNGSYTLTNIQEIVTELEPIYQYDIDLEYQNNKYLINSVADLNKVVQAVKDTGGCSGMYFLLNTDLTDVGEFEGIAVDVMDEYGYEQSFTGTFDGGGHTISGMTITANAENVGFIGNLQGTMSNLTLKDCQVTNTNTEWSMTGMLAGSADYGTIEHCRVLGGSVTGAYAGAIAYSVSGSDNLYDSNVIVTSGGEVKTPGTCGTVNGDYGSHDAAVVGWTVNFVDGFDASVEMAEPQFVANNDAPSRPTVDNPPTHEHFTFNNQWQFADDSDCDFAEDVYHSEITANTTLYARWVEEAAYTVTLSDGQAEASTIEMKVYVTDVQSGWALPGGNMFTPSTGYEFDHWVYDGANYDAGDEIQLSDDISVTATWKLVNYGITTTAAEHGTISAAETAHYNASITVTVKPDTGYALDALTCQTPKDEPVTITATEGAYVFNMPDDDVTLTAKFRPVDYAIAATLDHATLRVNYREAAANATAHYGDTVMILPEYGYELASATVKQGENDVTVTDGVFTMPAGDVTVTATFKQVFTITFEAGYEMPEGWMEDVTVDVDASYALPDCGFTAPEGKVFKAWKIGETEYAVGAEITVEANTTVTAQWALAVPVIAGYDLVLDGTLGLRFYVSLPEDFDGDGAYMAFSIHGRAQDVPLSGAKTISGYKVFTCNVQAHEMAESIAATFHYGESQSVKDSWSIKQYLAKFENDNTKTGNLVAATMNYGHYVQPYMAELHHWIFGEGMDYAVMPYASAIAEPMTDASAHAHSWNAEMDKTVVAKAQYYLTLDSSTTLNITVKFNTVPDNWSVKVDNHDWIAESLGDNTWLIKITDIASNNLGNRHDVQVTADGKVVFDLNVSPLSYVNTVLSGTRASQDERLALTALYNYYAAAYAYMQP